jgi:hypothetical protein
MDIKINNLTKAQELAVIDMLAQWCYNGGAGHSAYVAFYADGDGNFHPKILVDGEKPKHYKMASGEWAGKEKNAIYKIDFDLIARDLWRIEKDNNTEVSK